ncbi:MAG: hypothetical protein ACTSP1_11760 [Candidatus Freyarchaeota archaeon]
MMVVVLARIISRIISITIFLGVVVLIQVPLVIQSINTINLSSVFMGGELQAILVVWLVDSLLVAMSFEWISLILSVIPFIITLPFALIYTALSPVYGWIVLMNITVISVLIFGRIIANLV